MTKHTSGPLKIEKIRPQNITFAATLKSKLIKVFVGIIKAMNSSTGAEITEMQLSANGLKYIVEESKSFQTAAYIKKEFFESFNIRFPKSHEDLGLIGFGVNLRSFTELLTAIIDNGLGSMNIVYYHKENLISFTYNQTDNGDAPPVNEDDGTEIVTDYYVQTAQSIEPIDFELISPYLCHSLIFSAYEFHSILNDFDRTTDEIEIKVTDKKMQLKAIGILQYGVVVKIERSSDIFSKFECVEASKFTYKFSYFKSMLKTLLLATKVSLITHIDGMLRIQLMVKNDEDEEDTAAFIEYNIIPNIPEDDEEEEEI